MSNKRYFVRKNRPQERWYVAEGETRWCSQSNRWTQQCCSTDHRNTSAMIASGKFTEVNEDMTPIPAFPRYFVDKSWGPEYAYLRFDNATEEGGRMKTDGTWLPLGWFLNISIKERQEITAAQAAALVVKPKVVRYFVDPGHNCDHIRFTGEVGMWVHLDGEEEKSMFGTRDFETDRNFKEVFPDSSDSLRRSHRYAAKYDEGKAAGKKESAEELAKVTKQLRENTQGRDNQIAYNDKLKQQIDKLEHDLHNKTSEAASNMSNYHYWKDQHDIVVKQKLEAFQNGKKAATQLWLDAYNEEVGAIGTRLQRRTGL